MKGQSGSIVYVIEKETNDLLVLGMLIRQQSQSGNDGSSPVYECTVMWPAMQQVQALNSHKVTGLCTVECDTMESTADTISSLQSSSADSGIDSMNNQ